MRQYLLDTINAVLDMSQIDADRLELQSTEVELVKLVQFRLDVVRSAAEVKDLILRLVAGRSLCVFAD